MEYFKIGTNNFSSLVNSLNVTYDALYRAQVSAAGNTVADIISTKRTIEVGFIPLDANTAASLLSNIKFSTTISFREPKTGGMANDVKCMVPTHGVEYYTIRDNNTSLKAFTVTFQEL